MKKQGTKLAVIVISLALIAVGCSANAPQSSAPFPTGTFSAKDNTAGRFELELKADGNFTIKLFGGEAGPPQGTFGTYTIAQTSVVFKGALCDSGDKAAGTYAWNFDGKTLTLTSSDDKCADRWRALNLVWTKE